jgi:hypothetical protein
MLAPVPIRPIARRAAWGSNASFTIAQKPETAVVPRIATWPYSAAAARRGAARLRAHSATSRAALDHNIQASSRAGGTRLMPRDRRTTAARERTAPALTATGRVETGNCER